jgi:WD40 repeat protein
MRMLVWLAAAAALAVGVPSASAAGGDQLWVSRYDGTAGIADAAYALGVSPDGSKVFVTGTSDGTGVGPEPATVAYDAATGAQLWAQRYEQDGLYGSALAVSADGSKVFVKLVSLIVAYDAATGNQLWSAAYDGFATAIGASPDGSKVFVAGVSGSGTARDYATVAYDAATGAQLWVSRYDRRHVDGASALGVSPDGGVVFVTGTSGSDYATVAYDAVTGTQLWVSTYNGRGFENAYALGVSPDGSKVVATGSSTSETGEDYATVAYDAATGSRLWVKRYNGPGNGQDRAHAVAVSPDSSKVFVTGVSTAAGGQYDYATVAYDASTGGALWTKRCCGGGASALGISPDGSKLFVTGGSGHFTTVAHDAGTGALLWMSRYGGAGDGTGSATGLGVSPDGSRLFVTGGDQFSRKSDYTTIAYSAN